jgi:hypothetical protein
VVRVCQVIDSVLAFEQPLARARQFLARREELWSFYTLLGPVNADLSERDAMASTRAGILLESADQILSSYAVNQDWDGEVDRLHHAPNDLVAAREELESLLEPCLRQMRRELRARRGVIEEWAEAVARDMVRESGDAAE